MPRNTLLDPEWGDRAPASHLARRRVWLKLRRPFAWRHRTFGWRNLFADTLPEERKFNCLENDDVVVAGLGPDMSRWRHTLSQSGLNGG